MLNQMSVAMEFRAEIGTMKTKLLHATLLVYMLLNHATWAGRASIWKSKSFE